MSRQGAVWLLAAALAGALGGCVTQQAAEAPPVATATPETAPVEEPSPTLPEPTPEPSPGEVGAAEETGPTPTPEVQAEPPEPRRVEFQSEDGIPLVGVYYPPASAPAPGVLLLHQNRASKEHWVPLIEALRAPSMPTYAIFAIDFPGHGESGGSLSDAAALAAARTALSEFRTFDGVDANRVILIGASFGADAAVDVCGEGCIGAVSVSPGGWLGIPYQEALTALREQQDPPVLCIASQQDEPSPSTCKGGETAGLSDYRVHIYDGSAHGNFLFFEETLTPPPPIIDLIVQWLSDHLAGSG